MDLFGKERSNRARQEQDVLDRLLRWLDDHRAEYEKAVTSWNDLEWCHAALEGARMVWQALQGYRPGEEPVKAVYLIAQAVLSLGSVFQQLAVINEYQECKAQLERLCQRATEAPGA
jgi:hypothetical protein